MKISAYHKYEQKVKDDVTFVKGIKSWVKNIYWDRVYISTVFTYNWRITKETILYYLKEVVKDDKKRIFVGGILASLMPEQLYKETGVIPITGVLDKPGMLDKDNKAIVDNLIPDYDLFEGSEQKYSLVDDSYFGYSTRGCSRGCEFCGVQKLEGPFQEYTGIKPYVNGIKENYEEKPYLVLFDNNILESERFAQIIYDIRDLGFGSGEKFSYQSKDGRTIKRLKRVDFNQGTDARHMREKHVKLLSTIALHPLRIAFDHIKYEKIYTTRIRWAAKYGIRNLSNYVLYNFNDTPEDLWKRLKINIDLNKELGLKIYSFPMKYIPLNAKDRSYIYEPSWNWQFIRGVQRILNVLKGTVMTSEEFFYRAFGENEKEFVRILHMPERILMNRGKKPSKEEEEWRTKFINLTGNEQKELLEILLKNHSRSQLFEATSTTKNGKIRSILDYYLPPSKYYPLFKDMN